MNILIEILITKIMTIDYNIIFWTIFDEYSKYLFIVYYMKIFW